MSKRIIISMSQFLRFLAATAIFLTAANFAAGQKNDVASINDLDGMAGCWERNDKAKSLLVSEQWLKPAGTSILGMGRTVKKGKTVDYEYMRIEERADGIYFVSKPKANTEETAFKLIRSTSGEIVFQNPDHDFPQRVIYKLKGTKLTGRIEGTENGKFLGIDFPMNRVKCN